MGFFSFLFGTGGYAQNKFSKVEHALSKIEIKKLVSHYTTQSLDQHDEDIIEKVIELRRNGDGKISLWQIDEVLKKLVQQKSIRKYDREGVMKVFKNYFETK